MKTSKELFERLQNDEAFAKEFEAKVKAKVDAGEKDIKAIWLPIAEEYGYELTAEELDSIVEQKMGELSDEELGKVAGGTTFLTFIPVLSITLTVSNYLNDQKNK